MFEDKAYNLMTYDNFSAGVGRTGTFIAVDYMLQQGPTQRFITIPKLVDELRRQRINMVQSVVCVKYKVIYCYNLSHKAFYFLLIGLRTFSLKILIQRAK